MQSRLVRVIFGLFFLLGAMVCAVSAFIFISDPQTKNPLLSQVLGVVMGLLAIWIFSLAIRLLFNWQRPGGGLFSPALLRVFSIYFVALPTFMIVTGRSASWHFLEYLHAGLAYIGALGLWRLAVYRSVRAQSNQAQLIPNPHFLYKSRTARNSNLSQPIPNKNYIKKTNLVDPQMWKLRFCGLAALIIGVGFLTQGPVGRSLGVDPAAIALIATAFSFVILIVAILIIRCPSCHLSLVWYALSKQPMRSWLSWLLDTNACPRCGFSNSSPSKT
jgi:hypothetical protein